MFTRRKVIQEKEKEIVKTLHVQLISRGNSKYWLIAFFEGDKRKIIMVEDTEVKSLEEAFDMKAITTDQFK